MGAGETETSSSGVGKVGGDDDMIDVDGDVETANEWRHPEEDQHNSTLDAESSDSELPPTPGSSPRPFNLKSLSSTLPKNGLGDGSSTAPVRQENVSNK